jgi:hypothetical protein
MQGKITGELLSICYNTIEDEAVKNVKSFKL